MTASHDSSTTKILSRFQLETLFSFLQMLGNSTSAEQDDIWLEFVRYEFQHSSFFGQAVKQTIVDIEKGAEYLEKTSGRVSL